MTKTQWYRFSALLIASTGTLFAQSHDLASALQKLSSPLGYQDAMRVSDQFSTADGPEVRLVVPRIVAQLSSNTPAAQRNAGFAVLCIASRRDGFDLLESSIPTLLRVFDHGDPATLRFALQAILVLGHVPSNLLKPALIAFLDGEGTEGETDLGRQEMRAMSVAVFMQYSPDDNSVFQAITRYLSQPLQAGSRILAIRGLSNVRTSKDLTPRFSELLLPALQDRDPAVKKAAVETAGRFGSKSSAEVINRLSALRADPHEGADVRDAAAQAFNQAQGVHPKLPELK